MTRAANYSVNVRPVKLCDCGCGKPADLSGFFSRAHALDFQRRVFDGSTIAELHQRETGLPSRGDATAERDYASAKRDEHVRFFEAFNTDKAGR